MTNMERFDVAKGYWAEIFQPQTRVERHLLTLIAFQDLLIQRSMTQALSAREPWKAISGEQRQNELIISIDRLVQTLVTVQQRRAQAPPPSSPAKVVEMPKRGPKKRPVPVEDLTSDQTPSLHPFGTVQEETEAREPLMRFRFGLSRKPAA